MALTVSFALQKGGTGKTTTVANTAYILAEAGKKVAVVDFDSQGNLSQAFGVDPDNLELTIMDVILGKCHLKDICFNKLSIDIYPANDWLSRLDMVLIKHSKEYPKPGHVLKNILDTIKNNYDYILIDLPPSLGLLTINGLTASDALIIPMQCEYFAMSGLRRMLSTINSVIIPDFNPDIKVMGVLPTMFDRRLNLNVSVLESVRKDLANSPYKVYDTCISRATKFGFAPIKGRPAVEIYKDDKAVQEYRNFVKEAFGVW